MLLSTAKPHPKPTLTTMSENQAIHIYKMRFLFKGDDFIGKYDARSKTVHLPPAYEHLRQEAKGFMMRAKGIPAKVLVGDETLPQATPLREFPPEILALATPELGERTPALIDHARKHFGREEFQKRYGDGYPFGDAEETPAPVVEEPPQEIAVDEPAAETAEETPASEPVAKPARKRAAKPAPEK